MKAKILVFVTTAVLLIGAAVVLMKGQIKINTPTPKLAPKVYHNGIRAVVVEIQTTTTTPPTTAAN